MADLITRQEYKTYAGISSTNHDAEIDFLIPKISDFVKTYCRRTFVDYVSDVKLENFNGNVDKFLLKEGPVIQVLSVEFSQDYGQTYTKLTKFTDWVADGDQVISLSASGVFPKAINGYKVSYYGGFDPLPGDIKLAVLDLITYYRRNDSAIHSTKSPGTNNLQIEYISTTNLPAHIKRVLDQYMADYA